MTYQIEHLPKDKPATEREGYGFTIEDFLEDNWLYLLGVLFVIGIFLYARNSWRKRNKQ